MIVRIFVIILFQELTLLEGKNEIEILLINCEITQHKNLIADYKQLYLEKN